MLQCHCQWPKSHTAAQLLALEDKGGCANNYVKTAKHTYIYISHLHACYSVIVSGLNHTLQLNSWRWKTKEDELIICEDCKTSAHITFACACAYANMQTHLNTRSLFWWVNWTECLAPWWRGTKPISPMCFWLSIQKIPRQLEITHTHTRTRTHSNAKLDIYRRCNFDTPKRSALVKVRAFHDTTSE